MESMVRFVATDSKLKNATWEKPTSATFRVTYDGHSLVFMLAKMIDSDTVEWIDPELPKGISDDFIATLMIKNLSVNNICIQFDFSERHDGCGQMIQRDEAAVQLLVAHQ